MNILLIYPSLQAYDNKQFSSILDKIFYKFIDLNSAFHALAAVTPKYHKIKIINEQGTKIDFDINVDLVGITGFTMTITRAYEIAEIFRNKGVKVVLGGWHVSALPDEAMKHADSIIIGEAENTWPQLLKDLENNNLKKVYKQKKLVKLNSFCYITKKERIQYKTNPFVQPIEASRGCPNRCNFCSISNSKFGRIYRTKPIINVINEIQTIPEKFLNFCDSSLTINPKYSKELFKEMKGLNKKFFCEGNANILNKDEELLNLAAEAGCISWCVGFESISQETLNRIGKKINRVNNYASMIKKIHNYGMSVKGSLILGFDSDNLSIFDKTLEVLNILELDTVDLNILTPFPGTPLYKQLENEGRILTKDWTKYDTEHVVFQPKQMTVDELYSGVRYITKEYYSNMKILKMGLKTIRLGLYPFVVSFLSNYYYNRQSRSFI
jgi:radical SAM superfamily enzyme YgiQ (UPF0313 family)